MNKEEGSLILGSKKFQEETGRRNHSEKIAEFVKNLANPKTGLLKDELAIKRDCPLCGEKPEFSRIIFVKEGFHYRKCNRCDLFYVSPILKEEVLTELYKKSDYAKSWMNILLNPVEQKFNQPKFELGIREIEDTLGRRGKLLEVGCAVGQFLNIARGAGWDVVGLELNKEECEYCRRMDFEIVDKPLTDELFQPETFDAVAMWEVLEHVTHPREIVRSIYKVLKPGGVFLTVVPSVDALAARILQEKCNSFFGMAHINMFSNLTLTNLLEDEKFNVIKRTSIISEVSIINNYLSYEDPYQGDAKMLRSIFDLMNEDYINKNLLGYKLKFIARK